MRKFLLRQFFVCIFLGLGVGMVHSQDLHFSQFSQSPLFVNPAYTGMFDGNWRFSNNYRTQWSAVGNPFSTISVGFDKPFKLRKGGVGLGVFVANDQSGSAVLTANKIFLSLSYHRKFGKHKLFMGAQAGYVLESFEIDPLTFPSQYNDNTGLFDSGMPNYLDNWDDNINYPDINLGIAWTANLNGLVPIVGFSVFHVNSPPVSLLKEDAKLSPRFAANASTYIPLKNRWYVKPDIYTNFQKTASNYLAGGTIGYNFPLEEFMDKVYAGAEVRTQFHSTDALVAVIGFGFMGLDVGLSYDLNISGLSKATNMRGAFEVSLVYTNFVSELNRISIPCDRF
jgi:type IX secretion system PorP/SprF family membrane protein